MKEINISLGGSSGQGSLIIGLLVAALGVHNLTEGIDRGRIPDYIVAIIQLSLAGFFLFDWYRYKSGFYKMRFDSGGYEILTNGIATCSGKFRELMQINQDGRGYTISLPSGTQYRLLRRAMDAELQRTLDAVQQQAEQAAPSNGGQRPSLSSDFHPRRG